MSEMQALCRAFQGLKVMVLGDIMLDSYQWGKVQRISPEAPVPVIEINREEYRLGGAANVALNIASLGAEVFCVGLTGKDANARIIHKLFADKGLGTEGLVADPARKSTIKTRIGAVNQQIVRIDIEDTFYPSAKVQAQLIKQIKKQIADCDFLVIEDYNKGLLSPEIISATLALCQEYRVGVSVDPKQKNFFAYEGVVIFKPNYKELQMNLGLSFESEDEFYKQAFGLRERMKIQYLVVTRGAKGMFIFGDKKKALHLPTAAKEVYDVSGAGDTVISALSLAFAAGADIETAARLANTAAGVVVGKMGTATVSSQEILEYLNDKG